MGRPVRRRPLGGAGPTVGQRPVRLAARPVRPGRLPGARPGTGRRRPARPGRAGPDAGRPGRPGGRRAPPARSGPPSRTRTCTPRWSAACWSGSAPSAASCAPAGPATTRSPPTCGSTCATTPGVVAARIVELADALVEQAARHVHTPAPGHDPRAARPAGHLRPLAAGARPSAAAGPGAAARLGPPGGGQPAGRRRAGRLRAAAGPGGGLQGAGFPDLVRQLDGRGGRPGLRRRVPLRHRAARGAPVPARRGGGAVDLAGVRLGRAGRLLRHRLVDHAAEEERRHRRAGPGQVRSADRWAGRAC